MKGKGSDCGSCYTCENGIIPSVTADMMKSVLDSCEQTQIPKKWLTENIGNCEKCVTCEKGYGGEPKQEQCKIGLQDNKKGPKPISVTYFLFPTNECNLRCTYCYATKQPYVMSQETLSKTLDFIFNRDRQRFKEKGELQPRSINIQFFGGEPTICWDTIVKAVEVGNKIVDKTETVRWGMTTNCTLLNREKLRWLRHNNFKLLLSIDGPPAIHDKHRKTVAGKGSSHMIPINLLAEYFPNCEIRPTITPETVESFPGTLKWFYSKEFFTVATEVAYEADWTDEAMEKARKTYYELAQIYIKRKNARLPLWMKFIEDGRSSLGKVRQRGGVCGTGERSLAIDGLGFFYSCQRYASFSDRSIALGNVVSGFDEKKLAVANDFKREYMQPEPNGDFFCDECPALWRCKGGCNAMNYQVTGDRKFVMENHCKFQRLWAEMGLMALSATGELWDAFKRR